jgi:hypothetical protein
MNNLERLLLFDRSGNATAYLKALAPPNLAYVADRHQVVLHDGEQPQLLRDGAIDRIDLVRERIEPESR